MTRALLILTSHDRLGDTGRTTGWYLPEAAHPWQVFTEAGFDIDFASPAGGTATMDGVDLTDPTQASFLAHYGDTGPTTIPAADIDSGAYDIVLYVGGHGTMWDFPGNADLARAARDVYEAGGVIAAVCHGPAGLVDVTLSDGSYLVAGKRVAAFTNDEEAAVGLTDVVPFLLADGLTGRGAIHVPAANFSEQIVVDGRLVTGQNPASAFGVARAVVAAVAARIGA